MPHQNQLDTYYMTVALEAAERGRKAGEVPVGAVLVDRDQGLLVSTHNQPIGTCDPTAHAEILALRAGGRKLGNYRLHRSTLYVTVEPCLMCMGAIIHARIEKLVFGAADPRQGAAGAVYDPGTAQHLNHHPQIQSGVCEQACRESIQSFFQARRLEKRRAKHPDGFIKNKE